MSIYLTTFNPTSKASYYILLLKVQKLNQTHSQSVLHQVRRVVRPKMNYFK